MGGASPLSRLPLRPLCFALMGRFTGLLGIFVILSAAFLLSTHKRAIKLRLIAWGLGLQFAFALLDLKTDFGKLFEVAGRAADPIPNTTIKQDVPVIRARMSPHVTLLELRCHYRHP